MEAGVLKLALEFTDEVRWLENLVNLWRGEAKRNADTIDILRKERRQKDDEARQLESVKASYDDLCKDRDRAWGLLRGVAVHGETWTKGLCDEVEKLQNRNKWLEAWFKARTVITRNHLETINLLKTRLTASEDARKLWDPHWDGQADWGHPIVP